MRRRIAVRWLLALPLAFSVYRLGFDLVSRARRVSWRDDVRALEPHAADLVSLATLVWPSSLTPKQVDAIVREFMRWLEEQDADAEQNQLGQAPRVASFDTSHPGRKRAVVRAATYPPQIRFLKRRVDSSEASANRTASQSIVTQWLNDEGVNEIPLIPAGENIVVDLLSFFYSRPLALDLFHERVISARTCRGLAQLELMPMPANRRGVQ